MLDRAVAARRLSEARCPWQPTSRDGAHPRGATGAATRRPRRSKLRWRALTVRHCFHVLPGESILELGAGSGLWTEHLTRRSAARTRSRRSSSTSDLAEQLDARQLPNTQVVHVRDLAETSRRRASTTSSAPRSCATTRTPRTSGVCTGCSSPEDSCCSSKPTTGTRRCS